MTDLPDPATLYFEREWTFWLKINNSGWTPENFIRGNVIKTVKDMWCTIHHISPKCLSNVNIFIMEDGRIPLVESNGDTFVSGGSWSVVIKRQDWRKVIQETIMALMGEIKFSDSIRGTWLVPVNNTHTIVKLWSIDRNDRDGKALESLFENTNARFKAFDIS